MSQNLIINDIVYNGVDSLEMTNTAGEKITYEEVIPVVPGDPVAQIGSVTYDSVAKALAAAVSGDTVVMIADATEAADLVVPVGVNFDLAGFSLTMPSGATVTAATGANIVDNSTDNAGLIVVDRGNVSLGKDNTQVPFWVDTGYKFYAFTFRTNTQYPTETSVKFRFYIRPTDSAANAAVVALLKDTGASDHGVMIFANVSYEVNSGGVLTKMTYSDAQVKIMATSGTLTYEINDISNYTNLAITCGMISETGAEYLE